MLDRQYPHRCPAPREALEAIHRYAGKRELIDNLLWRWSDAGDEDDLDCDYDKENY